MSDTDFGDTTIDTSPYGSMKQRIRELENWRRVDGIAMVSKDAEITRLHAEAAELRALNLKLTAEVLRHKAEVERLKGALVTTAIRTGEIEMLVRKAIPWIRSVHQFPPKCECEKCRWVQSAVAALAPTPQAQEKHP